jgi:hypothetical protein
MFMQMAASFLLTPAATVAAAAAAAAGANPETVPQAFIDDWWPDKGAADKSSKPRSCSLAEVLLHMGLDVNGVADLHLGTSWLHEAVRCAAEMQAGHAACLDSLHT